MSSREEAWPVGTPSWADLSVPDLPDALAFYSAVLGWEFQQFPEFGGYAIGQVRGAAAAGVGPIQTPGQRAAWTAYFASEDADATAAQVTAAGGTILVPPDDVGPLGRFFVAMDPSGAVFGAWQAKAHIGAGIVNEPGAMSWEDLRSTDPDAARTFYSAVYGYDHQPMQGAPDDYQLFSQSGSDYPMGGIGGFMGPEETASHWLLYFGVADMDAALAAAEQHGGRVTLRDFDTPFGRMAGLTDPAGAVFWVIENPVKTDEQQP